MMLAQVTNAMGGGAAGMPDPHSLASIGWMVVMVAGALVIARNAVGFWRDVKPAPSQAHIMNQPLEVKEAPQFVDQAECERRHSESSAAIGEVKQNLKEMERVAAIQRKSMYDKIDQVRKDLTDKIDTMPAQIVSQLLSTKQLWREK